jgi:hypothetical protein
MLLVIALSLAMGEPAAPKAPAEIPVLYTRDDCIHCRVVSRWLNEWGVRHDTVVSPQGTVPRVSYRGKTVVGANRESLAKLLGKMK